MEVNEQLIRAITQAVVEQLHQNGAQPTVQKQTPDQPQSMAGRTKCVPNALMQEVRRQRREPIPKKWSSAWARLFRRRSMPLWAEFLWMRVLRNVKAGIEEEGMVSRVVKILDTSDGMLYGAGGCEAFRFRHRRWHQSKGTTVIHQKDLYPLSNLELFPQAPLMDLDTYRKIGRNAAKYVKGEKVTPIECTNDPMVRAKFQVKAALMHIVETEQLDPEMGIIEWEGRR